MLTDRQRSVLDFIQSEQREKGITPSTREIQSHFGFASQTSVMQYIATLERKGFLDRYARKARALVTPVQKVRITDIPIYGQIPAGMATLTEQTVLGHVSLDTRSANASKNARMFALKVRGDSMMNAHILDGDIVILDDRKEARNGDIVAALIDGETTLNVSSPNTAAHICGRKTRAIPINARPTTYGSRVSWSRSFAANPVGGRLKR
jgi:repressor LexA